jgi:hypothetical protein
MAKFGSNSVTDSIIDLGYDHGFQTGDAVVYDDGGGTKLGNLVDRQTYYVIRVDATRVKLADSLADAQAGSALVLGTHPTGSGANHSLRVAMDPAGNIGLLHNIGRAFSPTTDVTSTFDSVDLGYAHGFQKGQAVVYTAGTDPAIGGLSNNTVYYVVPDASSPNGMAGSAKGPRENNGHIWDGTFVRGLRCRLRHRFYKHAPSPAPRPRSK